MKPPERHSAWLQYNSLLLHNPHRHMSAPPVSYCMHQQQHQQQPGHAAFGNVFSTSLSATRGSGIPTPCAALLTAVDVLVLHQPLCLSRAESSYGFDPSSVGMSEKEATNIALAFGQVGWGAVRGTSPGASR